MPTKSEKPWYAVVTFGKAERRVGAEPVANRPRCLPGPGGLHPPGERHEAGRVFRIPRGGVPNPVAGTLRGHLEHQEPRRLPRLAVGSFPIWTFR